MLDLSNARPQCQVREGRHELEHEHELELVTCTQAAHAQRWRRQPPGRNRDRGGAPGRLVRAQTGSFFDSSDSSLGSLDSLTSSTADPSVSTSVLASPSLPRTVMARPE
jgi:hypothetical protein